MEEDEEKNMKWTAISQEKVWDNTQAGPVTCAGWEVEMERKSICKH